MTSGLPFFVFAAVLVAFVIGCIVGFLLGSGVGR